MSLCKFQIKFVSLLCLALISDSLAQSNPQDYINAHNKVRAEVGVGPMTWNKTVATYAYNYARKRAKDCNLVHSQGPYGENLAIGGAGTDAINMWVSEKPLYDHKSNSCKGNDQYGCFHYTQVVWRKSVRLGCARVKCQNKPDEEYFVICSYDPPGNYLGERPY